jgi:hypothetical protein
VQNKASGTSAKMLSEPTEPQAKAASSFSQWSEPWFCLNVSAALIFSLVLSFASRQKKVHSSQGKRKYKLP